MLLVLIAGAIRNRGAADRAHPETGFFRGGYGSKRGPAPDASESGQGGQVLHIPGIGVPIGNHDNNQHSFNENLRIQNLWDGIELMAALLTM
jgi:acetylornithine deacetylase/succinyl-diaminopimelate desuccinylase-like protein